MIGKVKFQSPAPTGFSTRNPAQDGLIHGALSIPYAGIPVSIPVAAGETAPQVGNSYIFCVTGDSRHGFITYDVFKIYPVTRENLIGTTRLEDDIFRK